MGKYQSLNVLNQQPRFELSQDEVVNKINAMVNASGNRSQRRKIAKSLHKTTTIAEYANKRANQRAEEKIDKQVEIRAEQDFMYIFGIIGLVMYNDYHWKESEDNDHGQITSLYERLTKKMSSYAASGKTTEDILNELEELTGISLVAEQR